MIIHPKDQWCLVHIPKTGGTSLGTILPNGAKRKSYHMTVAELQAEIGALFPQYFVFTFVRNPYTRLASYYSHFIKHDMPKAEQANAHTPAAFLRWVHTYIGGNGEGFARDADRNARYAKGCKSQVSWLSLDGKLRPDFIGRGETFVEDVFRLAKMMGFSLTKVPHSHMGRYDIAGLYCQESIKIVRQAYKDDFEMFDYPSAPWW